jgi:hypothetical protein
VGNAVELRGTDSADVLLSTWDLIRRMFGWLPGIVSVRCWASEAY